MARDPVTGRSLPDGMRLAGRLVLVDDSRGRSLPANIADRIVRGWRHSDTAPRSARLAYTAWTISRYAGPAPGVKQWQIDIARVIVPVEPTDWGAETEDVIAGILSSVSGGSGAAAVVPHPGQVISRGRPARGDVTLLEVQEPGISLRPGRSHGSLFLYTQNLDVDRRVRVYSRNRNVAYLGDWLPYTDEIDSIIELQRQLRIHPPAHRPAQLAWRLFRQFVRKSPALLPREAMLLCAQAHDTYVIRAPAVKAVPRAWVYDKNCAYGDFLRRLPDFSQGRFRSVAKYMNPFAIYETNIGVRSGFWIASMEKEESVLRGWAWDGNPLEPSPFADFVDFCFSWRGPLPKLVKRFPAFVVGKMFAHGYRRQDATIIARATFYPIVWVNVLGGLMAEMQKVISSEHPHHAFIDAVHLDHPATTLTIGPQIGEWKLVASGPATYRGLNRYQVGSLVKHQGEV